MAPEIRDLIQSYVGEDLMSIEVEERLHDRIREIPDLELWDAHMKCKRRMISYLRSIFAANWIERGYSPERVRRAREMLNAGFLTIGFARRFATYKRADLSCATRSALPASSRTTAARSRSSLPARPTRPTSWPRRSSRDIFDFARDYGLEDRIFFIENYARSVAEHIVQGCDLWLNNPIRPNEASGTSGMKAGINGVLNLSVLDGWWPEGFNGANGWAITAGDYYDNPEMRDAAEANQIYDYLEGEVSDLFYDRGESDIPAGWVQRMKESIFTVTRGFSITRMLRDYDRKFYSSALADAARLGADHGAAIKEIVARAHRLQAHWDKVAFRAVESDLEKRKTVFAEDAVTFSCYVDLDDLEPGEIEVELFYWRERGDETEAIKLKFEERYEDHTARYQGTLTLRAHGVQEIDARIVPADTSVREPLPEPRQVGDRIVSRWSPPPVIDRAASVRTLERDQDNDAAAPDGAALRRGDRRFPPGFGDLLALGQARVDEAMPGEPVMRRQPRDAGLFAAVERHVEKAAGSRRAGVDLAGDHALVRVVPVRLAPVRATATRMSLSVPVKNDRRRSTGVAPAEGGGFAHEPHKVGVLCEASDQSNQLISLSWQ